MRLFDLSLFPLLALAVGCASEPKGEADLLRDVTQLTTGFAKAGEAYFSDDGRHVVFQAEVPGETGYAMYVAGVRRDGDAILGLGTPVRVSPTGSRNTCGNFSPDGQTLIFASTGDRQSPDAPAPGYQRQGGNYLWVFERGMEVYRADGWRSATALTEAGRGVDLAQHPITANDAYDAECAFSPDGTHIVFASNREAIDGKPDVDLYVMRSDGTNVVRLTSTAGYDGGPFFSPNGRQLIYRSDRKGNDNLQVYVADLTFADGKITGLANERALTANDHVNWGPYWHPGGRHVIYATSTHGHRNYELYMTRTDAKRQIRVTYTDGFDGLPAFSRDGKHLMWSSKRTADGTTQLFVAKFRMPRYLLETNPWGTDDR